MLFIADIHDIADLQDEHQDDWAESWEYRYQNPLESGSAVIVAPRSKSGLDGGQRRNEDNCVKAHGLPDVGTDKQGTEPPSGREVTGVSFCRLRLSPGCLQHRRCREKSGYNAHNYNV